MSLPKNVAILPEDLVDVLCGDESNVVAYNTRTRSISVLSSDVAEIPGASYVVLVTRESLGDLTGLDGLSDEDLAERLEDRASELTAALHDPERRRTQFPKLDIVLELA